MLNYTACFRASGLLLLAALCAGLTTSALVPPAREPEDAVIGARFPTLSPDGRTVAFCYWGDIWSAPLDGSSEPRRLTDHLAPDTFPFYSPDGTQLAFSSTRSGNTDIWVMPSGGGVARQVTTHSGSDALSGWLADGSGVVFQSNRGQWSSDIWTVSVPARGSASSGEEHQLTAADHDSLTNARALPGGGFILNRGQGGRWWRKRYRGSAQNDIWRLDPPAHGAQWGSLTRLTGFDGRDDWPLVSGDGQTVYYVCDEDGFDNLWAYSLADGARRQLTSYRNDGVQWPGIQPGGDLLVYEFDGDLYTLDGRQGGTPQKLVLHIEAEGKNNWTTRVSFSDSAGDYAVSPDGKYAVIEYMGDLWAIRDPDTYRKDDQTPPDQDLSRAIRLTPTDAARERNPVFAPDSRHIAYSSDADGNYGLYVLDLADMTSRKVTTGKGDHLSAEFDSSNGDYLFSYSGNSELRRFNIKDGSSNRVAGGAFRGSFGYQGFSVSPDGKWVAYTDDDADWESDVFIVDSAGKLPPVNITRHPASDTSPQWARDGSRLVWRSDRDNDEWAYYAVELDPRALPLATEFFVVEDPKAKPDDEKPADKAGRHDESGDEDGEDDAEDSNGDDDSEKGKDKAKGKKDEPKVEVKIDFEDIHFRSRRITRERGVGSGILSDDGKWLVYQADPDGNSAKLWAIRADPRPQGAKAEGYEPAKLHDAGWSSPQLTADGKRIYYLEGAGRGTGGALRYAKFNDGKISGRESIPVRGEYTLDRRARWHQMFREGWHTMGERFYDPQMHGLDWPVMYVKYARYIDHIGTPEEFGYVFHEMLGELNASHLGLGMTENSFDPGTASSGHLGLEFADGTMSLPFPGAELSPSQRGLAITHITYNGPADQSGVDIAVGDTLLSIDGAEVRNGMRWYDLLADKAGLPVKLRVLKQGTGSEVDVVLKCASWGQYQGLLYREWEKLCETKVNELSAGRIGYIHISGMNQSELRKFEREFYSEMLEKDALIVDVRFNGGGNIHEQLFDILDRNSFGWSAPREAAWRNQPARMFSKPKALLINQRSASDAEIFPSGWRTLGLGPVIGVPTAGAVIGTGGFTLVDGSSVRLPYVGWYEPDGRNLETRCTNPDMEVVLDPNKLREGHDTQLEEAVRQLLAELAAQPVSSEVPKAYPPAY